MVNLPSTADPNAEGVEHRTQMLHDLGVLIALWADLEMHIEVAIQRLTKIDPLHNSIMLGSLQFKAKSSILYSILRLQGQNEAISKLKTAVSYAKRNMLMHSAIASEPDFSKFVFFYRTVDEAYKVQSHTFTALDFHKHVYRFCDLANDAIRELKIERSDINEYGRAARFDGIDE